VRDEVTADRVQLHRLLDHVVNLREVLQVALHDPSPGAIDAVEVLSGRGCGIWPAEELR
jgi:hypothetical protein